MESKTALGGRGGIESQAAGDLDEGSLFGDEAQFSGHPKNPLGPRSMPIGASSCKLLRGKGLARSGKKGSSVGMSSDLDNVGRLRGGVRVQRSGQMPDLWTSWREAEE